MMYVTIPLGPAISDLPYGLGSLGDLIGNTVGFGIVIGAILALIWLLLGGITWITSSGDKAKLEEARDRITQANFFFVNPEVFNPIFTLMPRQSIKFLSCSASWEVKSKWRPSGERFPSVVKSPMAYANFGDHLIFTLF